MRRERAPETLGPHEGLFCVSFVAVVHPAYGEENDQFWHFITEFCLYAASLRNFTNDFLHDAFFY